MTDWAMKPREPTPEMREAAASFGGSGGYSSQRGDEAVEAWRHMYDAAPPAPAAEPVALVKDVDEYGPMIDWYIHWAELRGMRLYTASPPVSVEASQQKSTLDRFNESMGTDECTPKERLRFFCSLAMSAQDWLDVEPFFDALPDSQQHVSEDSGEVRDER